MPAARNNRFGQGFTLLETMMVVAIIAILTAMAVPSYRSLTGVASVERFVQQLQMAEQGLRQYAIFNRGYPANVTTGVLPPGLQKHLPSGFDWTAPTPLGGNWNWDGKARTSWGFYFEYGISISPLYGALQSQSFFEDVDRRVDDGNLNTGNFRKHNQSWSTYAYAIQLNANSPWGTTQ